MAAGMFISQEYFDEVCIENCEDFELSEEEAVQETIQQLEADGKKLPSHLVLSFPTSPQGIEERKVNEDLKTCIERVKSRVDDSNLCLDETLGSLVDLLCADESQRVPRFVVYGGFEACVNLWRNVAEGRDGKVYQLLNATFMTEQSIRAANIKESVLQLEDLQKPLLRLWPTWLSTFEDEVSPDDLQAWNLVRINQLLQLANFGVKQNEPNKKAFMASKSLTTGKTTPSLLLGALDVLSMSDIEMKEHHRLVGAQVCRLVANVCTFDDFRMAQGAPTVASAHANVQSFHQENGVIRVTRYLQETKEITAILALRAMAIHDEIVQAMVAVGLLDTSADLLERLLSKDTDNDDFESTEEALTAIVGLLRNVCANDEIKSKLCIGVKSIVHDLVLAMEGFPEAFRLQEHGCATFAAMALRSPRNAEHLVKHHNVATWIVRAMQKHPSRTTLQRQGALALRNLVSRSTDLCPLVVQAGAAEALKDIAAKHVSCQDEVYAALRDLGFEASMLRVEQDTNGKLVMKQTEMFGERKSNFRPVFD